MRCVGNVVGQCVVCDSSDCILVDCQGCCAGGSNRCGVCGVGFVCWGCVSGRFMYEFGDISPVSCWQVIPCVGN